MATNFQGYNAGNARPEQLRITDIKVGDTLIRADWSFGYRSVATMTETVWTVAKVLKSRLVLTRTNHLGNELTVRVLVRNSKNYTYGNGEVQTDLEGSSDSWNRKAFYLFTPDEPKLAELRAGVAEAQVQQDAKRKAEEALEAFKRSMTVEQAEFTIAALQAFIETKKEETK